jgi:nitroimidazol reductase NimA-like FMN-containing flavoprotein (pyridoxamine 5'-phosphate oxidase superfamily)
MRHADDLDSDMPGQPADHAGLEMLPFEDCLRLLASAPVGRVGFYADGEVMILPVNHAVDGQDVVFRTAHGSKLSAAEGQAVVAFEADAYDPQTRSGWSVLVHGRAEVVYEDAEIQRLSGLGLHPWATAVDRPFWIRIRPTAVSGRQVPVNEGSAS